MGAPGYRIWLEIAHVCSNFQRKTANFLMCETDCDLHFPSMISLICAYFCLNYSVDRQYGLGKSVPFLGNLYLFKANRNMNSISFLQRQKVVMLKSSSKNLSNVNKLDIFIHFLSQKQQKLRFFDIFF